MAEKSKKYGFKKLLVAGLCLLVAGGALIGCKNVDKNIPETPSPGEIDNPVAPPEQGVSQLATPVLSFNAEINQLSWQAVDNATGYLVTVNGNSHVVTTPEITLELEEGKDFEVTVQALGDGETYQTSAEATYSGYKEYQDYLYYAETVKNVEKLFSEITLAYNTFTLEKIYAIDLDGTDLKILSQYVLSRTPNRSQIGTLVVDMSSVMESSDSSLKTLSESSKHLIDICTNEYNYNLNSIFLINNPVITNEYLEKVLADDNLTGNIKTYLDQGYTPEILYSHTPIGEGIGGINLYSAIKLEKDEDIKVVVVEHLVTGKNGEVLSKQSYLEGQEADIVEREYSEFENAAAFAKAQEEFNDKFEAEKALQSKARAIENTYVNNLHSETAQRTKTAAAYEPCK